MKKRFIYTSLLTASMLLMAPATFAAESKAAAPQGAASQGKASAKVVPTPKTTPAPKAAAMVKLIDINSASAKELATLPGITAEDAAKIVAGRPYGSKAWLVSNTILPEAKYPGISKLIIAKQPFKDGKKNIEALKKAKP